MSIFKKLVDTTYSSAPKLVKRYFPTVRSIEPETGIIQGLGLDGLPVIVRKDRTRELPFPKSETKVADILQEIKATVGLPPSPSHVEDLIGRATKGRIYQKHLLQGTIVEHSTASALCSESKVSSSLNLAKTQEKYEVGGIDIAEKTQLILQSPHPVRYVIERELYNSQQGLHLRLPSFHTWIVLFGRSLAPQRTNCDEEYDKLLDHIANASDSGMFSADIHHTIIDIPEKHPSFYDCSSQFHMGNKYAVLVGDYFAIRCIYYAERTKKNSVMVAITEGVEEFTTSSFGTNLFDKSVGFPLILSPSASVHDWIMYNQKAFGYFKGGLYAAFSLKHKHKSQTQIDTHLEGHLAKFVANLSCFLKACGEIEALEQSDLVVPSPFLLTSLPAILCQMENPSVFAHLRAMSFELNPDNIREVHDIIRKNPLSIKRSRNLILGFASETKQALRKVAKNSYYIYILDSLIDSVA